MQITYATGCNWTVQLGTLRFESTTERLLPGEVAPMFERSRHTFGAERSTCWKVAMFRRRLLVDVITPAR